MSRIATATLLTLLACFCLNAESVVLQANVPFEFRMGEVHLPAGVYVVFEDRGLVRIRNRAGAPSAIYLTTPTERKIQRTEGILEFNRYNGENFLTKLWVPESTKGLILPMGKREKELISRSAAVQVAAVRIQRK
ncbi:MAG: hypothetical protein JNN08_07965 [Bryobacterales bacterium]|nr:hypothetical protein [Bryobacterales bacterium]